MFLLIMTYNWCDISKDFTGIQGIQGYTAYQGIHEYGHSITIIWNSRSIWLRASPPLSEQPVLLSAVGHFGASVVQLNGGRFWERWEKVVCIFLKKKKSFLSNDGWRRKEILWRTYGCCRRGWSKEHVFFWNVVLVLRTASVQACSSVFNIKNYYKFNVI